MRGSYQSVDTHEEDEFDAQLPRDEFESSQSSASPSLLQQLTAAYHSLPQLWQSRLRYTAACFVASMLILLLIASSASHRRHVSAAPPPPSASASSSALTPAYQKPIPPPSTVTASSAFSPPSTSSATYLGVTLSNHLEALLISSPSSPSCAASLSVGSGTWSDPASLPGLSHFLEHALFMGTEAFPEENEYSSFLSAHGGQTNAYTGEERTVFFFSVEPAGFEGALQRFASFFISPLLRADAMQREVKAVNSEHEKNLRDDGWREYELFKSQAAAGHPYNRFGTGNAQTLKGGGDETRQAMLSLFHRFYHSGNMKLVLLGREPLQELRQQAEQLFSPIPFNSSFVPDALPPPFPPSCTGHHLYIQPVSLLHQLTVFFPLTPTTLSYLSSPTAYVSFMLGQEGEGSLPHWLREQGWATSVQVGMLEDGPELSVLQVTVRLTQLGVFHHQEAVVRLFQQLQLIESEGVTRERWEEQRRLRRMQYLYGTQPTAMELVSTLSARLLTVPMPDVLLPPERLEWDEAAVRAVLAEMTVQRCIIHVISSSFEDPLFNAQEPVYGTRYHAFTIDPELVKLVDRGRRDVGRANVSDLALPPPNPFVFEPEPASPTVPSSTPSSPSSSSPSLLAPVLYRETFAERLYYQRDLSFNQPKAVLYLSLVLPHSTRASLRAFTLLSLYTRVVAASFQSDSYPATLAGYDASVSLSHCGLQLTLSGFSAHIHTYASLLLRHLVSPSVSPALFASIVREYEEDLSNTRTQLAYAQALYWLGWWLSSQGWREEEIRAELPAVTMANYTADWKQRVLGQSMLESLAYGDADEELMARLSASLHAAPAPLSFLASSPSHNRRVANSSVSSLLVVRKQGDMLLPPAASSYLYQHANLNPADVSNAAVVVHVPLSPFASRSSSALASLLSVLVRQPAFDVLRTQQQLGYIVSAGCSAVSSSSLQWDGLTVLVQGVEQGAEVMDRKVEDFLQAFVQDMEGWDAEVWTARVDGWKRELSRKPERLEDAAAERWLEVQSGRQWWRRREEQTAAVEAGSQQQFVRWCRDILLGPGRRRLSVQVLNPREQPRTAAGVFSLEPAQGGAAAAAAAARPPEAVLLRSESRDEQRQSWSTAVSF